MAQLVELQDKKDEAKTNYAWTANKLEEKRQKEPEDADLKELWGMCNHLYVTFQFLINQNAYRNLFLISTYFFILTILIRSYGKFLLRHGKFTEAAERLKSARDVFLQVHGRYDPDYVNLLNDVAVACLHVRNLGD